MELQITITNLPELIEALKGLVSAVGTPQAKAATKTVETKAAKVVEKVVETSVEEEDMFGSPDQPTVDYTFEDVKAKLAKLSQGGKQAEVKALITSFDAAKLSDIHLSKYAELMKKAAVIG